jgi:hypothetical protein
MGLLQTTPHAGFPEGFFGNFIPAEPLRLKTSPRNLHHLLQSAGNMGGLFYVWNIAVIHWIVSAKKISPEPQSSCRATMSFTDPSAKI